MVSAASIAHVESIGFPMLFPWNIELGGAVPADARHAAAAQCRGAAAALGDAWIFGVDLYVDIYIYINILTHNINM